MDIPLVLTGGLFWQNEVEKPVAPNGANLTTRAKALGVRALTLWLYGVRAPRGLPFFHDLP
jgi:hypothetical protein